MHAVYVWTLKKFLVSIFVICFVAFWVIVARFFYWFIPAVWTMAGGWL